MIIGKQGTTDSSLAWFSVGEYKKRANVVGGRETARPEDVPERMRKMLADYEALPAHVRY